jgi:hypothetical protein
VVDATILVREAGVQALASDDDIVDRVERDEGLTGSDVDIDDFKVVDVLQLIGDGLAGHIVLDVTDHRAAGCASAGDPVKNMNAAVELANIVEEFDLYTDSV